ncbi:MAG TPA: hypothetical protein VGO62_19370 [Myxococcota bacterium]
MTIRIAILLIALAPYLFFALKDGAMHLGKQRVRDVSLGENALHFIIIAPIAWLVAGMFREDAFAVSLGALAFIVPALVDEMYFHRRIPERETDAHAKGHIALFAFVVVGAVTWLDDAGVAQVLPWR